MLKISRQCVTGLADSYRFYSLHHGSGRPPMLLQKNIQHAIPRNLNQIHTTLGCRSHDRNDCNRFDCFDKINQNNPSNFFQRDRASVCDECVDGKIRQNYSSKKNVMQCSTDNYECYPEFCKRVNLIEQENDCYPPLKEKKYPVDITADCFRSPPYKPIDVEIGARVCHPHLKERECPPLEQKLSGEYPDCPLPDPVPGPPRLEDLEESPYACRPADSPLRCPIPSRPDTLSLPPSPSQCPVPETPDTYEMSKTPLPCDAPLKPDRGLLPPSPLPCAPPKEPHMCPTSMPPKSACCPAMPPICLCNPKVEPKPCCPEPHAQICCPTAPKGHESCADYCAFN